MEVSGIASSWRDPALLWMHNDSGDRARIYAVTTAGRLHATVELVGVEAVDFEDIAVAGCPDGRGPCVWVADVGDNAEERDDAVVYVMPEPELGAVAAGAVQTLAPRWRFPVRYPGGPRNVEALFVEPEGARFYVIDKVDQGDATIFRSPAPLTDGVLSTLEHVASFAAPGVEVNHGRKVTGADLHPGKGALVLRVYTGIYEYPLASLDDLSRLGEIEPLQVALGPFAEPQGEAVAYDAAGTGIWSVSEDPEGRGGQPLHHYGCW